MRRDQHRPVRRRERINPAMDEFDIASLLAWRPMEAVCINCRALFPHVTVFGLGGILRCPSCGFTLRPEPTSGELYMHAIKRFAFELRVNGPAGPTPPDHANLLRELLALGKAAQGLRHMRIPPRTWLYQMLGQAQLFIHVSSFSTISPSFLTQLSIGALRVPVYGIVGQADAKTAQRLAALNHIMPSFAIRPWAGRGLVPHHKLIIIDGLIALVGSTNLTDTGWAKIALGREFLHVVTRPSEVVRLNNTLFAPCWAAMSPLASGELLDLALPPDAEPPFDGDLGDLLDGLR
jgi:hypothetical protein